MDEYEAELAELDTEQIADEVAAAKEAARRAVADITLWRTYRAAGIGRITACMLVVTRAATDLV